ncbi:MAG: rhomboid family intramembrane serine protease [Pseudomonadota bacterium]
MRVPWALEMDIEQILFLIAILNLLGDLFNIFRFRQHVPRWVAVANIAALALCVGAKIWLTAHAGAVSCAVLVVYIVMIKVKTGPRRARRESISAPCTKGLIITTALAFGYQLYRGAGDDPEMMVELGAMFSPLFEGGDWWRLFSAQFLHWGIPHVALNMMGLWFLGPLVEQTVGSVRFVVAYLLCGAGGMVIAWAIATFGPDPRSIILLGASASVLGMVGLQVAIARRLYRTSGSLAAKAQLSAMVQILVLQVIFDSLVPQISSTAHLGGAAVGLILGFLFLRRAADS